MDEQILSEVLRKMNIILDERNGIKTSGMGMLANNTDAMLEVLNKMNNTLMHLENKVEALMDKEAQERHEQIKRRFSKY